MKKTNSTIFTQPTPVVAKALIGKQLVYESTKELLAGIITETEAYTQEDPACHAYLGKKTSRNQVMFEKPGTIYIYFIYGMYHCLNFVTEEQGRGCAVLIRGIQPTHGIKTMQQNRPNHPFKNLANGPAKLVLALNLPTTLNGTAYNKSPLYIADKATNMNDYTISEHTRIGISKGKDKLWRYKLDFW